MVKQDEVGLRRCRRSGQLIYFAVAEQGGWVGAGTTLQQLAYHRTTGAFYQFAKLGTPRGRIGRGRRPGIGAFSSFRTVRVTHTWRAGLGRRASGQELIELRGRLRRVARHSSRAAHGPCGRALARRGCAGNRAKGDRNQKRPLPRGRRQPLLRQRAGWFFRGRATAAP